MDQTHAWVEEDRGWARVGLSLADRFSYGGKEEAVNLHLD